MKSFSICAICALIALMLSTQFPGSHLSAQQVDWTTLWGQGDVKEFGFDIAADDTGSVYVFGSDRGVSGSDPGSFIVKHDDAGDVVWSVRDSGIQDFAYGGTVDSFGNVYMSGGSSQAGPPNAIVSKYDSLGDRQWIRQFGTALPDWAEHVHVDNSGAYYSVGQTLGSFGGTSAGDFDVFIRKTTGSGGEIWTTQIGSDGYDFSANFVVDDLGNSYLTGTTSGSTDSDGIFATRVNANGEHEWTQLLGSGQQDTAEGIAIDQQGNTFITGHTTGDLGSTNVGGEDFFFSMIDASGSVQWTRQLGTPGDDIASDILVDDFGNIHIAGTTDGNAFLNRYDAGGNLLWNTVIDQPGLDLTIQGLAMGPSGEFYIGGYAYDPLTDDHNVFIARINSVPEPGSLAITVSIALCLLTRRHRMSNTITRPEPVE